MFFKTIPFQSVPLALKFWGFFKSFLVMLPVVFLVYQDKGLTIGDFFLIQGLFSYVIFFLEIPTGYIGDLFSRKKVIVFGSLMNLLGYVLLFYAEGFWQMFAVEALWGISIALISGTRQAYLYDVLKSQNKQDDAIKEEGRQTSWGLIGTTIATFIGGTLYVLFGVDSLLLFHIVLMAIPFIISLYLPELKESKRIVEKGKSKIKDILDISKYAVNHPEIKWLMLFPGFMGMATLVLLWSMQPLMEFVLFPVALFGVFMGISQLFRVFMTHFAANIFNFLKTKKYTIFLFLLVVVGFVAGIIGTQLNNFILLSALLILIGLGVSTQAGLKVVTTSMINHRIKSDERATVLSVNSMVARFMGGAIMISTKFIIDGFGMFEMYVILGILILSMTYLSMKKLLRLKI